MKESYLEYHRGAAVVVAVEEARRRELIQYFRIIYRCLGFEELPPSMASLTEQLTASVDQEREAVKVISAWVDSLPIDEVKKKMLRLYYLERKSWRDVGLGLFNEGYYSANNCKTTVFRIIKKYAEKEEK